MNLMIAFNLPNSSKIFQYVIQYKQLKQTIFLFKKFF